MPSQVPLPEIQKTTRRHIQNTFSHIIEALPQKGREQFDRQIDGLASVMHSRNFRTRDFKEVVEKSAHLVRTPRQLHDYLSLLAGDLNLAHVIFHAPKDILPRTVDQLRDDDERATLIGKTLLHRMGVPAHDWKFVEEHGRWRKEHRELARIVASGEYVNNPQVRELLDHSYHQSYDTHYAEIPENKKTREQMREHGLDELKWLRGDWEKTYDSTAKEIEEGLHAGRVTAHARFYDILSRAYQNQRNTGVDARKIMHYLKEAGKAIENEKAAAEFTRTAEEHLHILEKSTGTVSIPDRYLLDREKMHDILLTLTGKISGKIAQLHSKNKPIPQELEALADDVITLERITNAHDEEVSLRQKVEGGKSGMTFVFRRQTRDFGPFATGGNDSGVCDSTMERSALKRVALAKNFGYRENKIEREFRGKTRRIGQIRNYAALVTPNGEKEPAPAMIINSIDVEAEQRKNMMLYVTALKYSHGFSRNARFQRTYIAETPDMAVRAFLKNPLFHKALAQEGLELKPIEQAHVELIDGDRKPSERFSDIFGGGKAYEQGKGTVPLYELRPLPRH